jgi:hypothetical protein
MIPARSKRMTVAQLKERMDARFKSADKRFDAVDKHFDAIDKRFDALEAYFRQLFRSMESLGQKVETNRRAIKAGFEHQAKVLHEHDGRITDLEPPRL